MKKAIILIISVFIIIITTLLIYQFTLTKEEVKYQTKIVSNQKKLDQKISSYGYTIENPKIILNPYEISPLTALVIFETKEEETPTITIKGQDTLTTFYYQTPKSKVHYVPIYGLYPNYNNEISITYNEVNQKINILTDKLPEKIVKPKVITKKESELTNDLYFYTSTEGKYPCAYDVNGDIRWYLTEKLIGPITRLNNGHILLSTERELYNSYMTGLYEMDLNGKIYTEYQIDGGYGKNYYELPNGNILLITSNTETNSNEDYIIEINKKTGQTVKTINLSKMVNPKNNSSSAFYPSISDLSYDKQTNSLIVIEKSKNLVFNINYKTNQINYIIGCSNELPQENEKYFLTSLDDNPNYQKRPIAVLPNQDIVMFKNLSKETKTQSIITSIYHINNNSKTITETPIYETKQLQSTLSLNADVDYINDNHYLIHHGETITSSKIGKITTTEIKNGNVIWEIELPISNYQSEKISLNGFTYQKTSSISLNNFKETEIFKKQKIIFRYLKKNEYYNKRKIEIYQDTDRLFIMGEFLKEDNIKIILEKNFQKKIYNIKDQTNNLCQKCQGKKYVKTINKTNIKGTYSIYIEINDKVYKTNQHINF